MVGKICETVLAVVFIVIRTSTNDLASDFYMVIVADIGKAPDCGSGDCGFDSHLSPKLNIN